MGELVALMAVVLPMVIAIVAIRSKHQQQMAQLNQSAGTVDAERYEAAIRRLDDRVQVLERIITDRGYDVAAQIEALRADRTIGEAAPMAARSTIPVA